jgi:hypothetical protein
MSKVITGKSAEQRREEAARLHDSITIQLDELTSTEGWAQFLKLAVGFHRYSLSNLLLIMAQCPDATHVAGFRQWQDRGRQVRKGEKSIRIFGYSTKRVPAETEEEEDKSAAYFPVLSVFDVSQTDPIDGVEPVLEVAPRLRGDDRTGIFDAVASWLTDDGWTVTRKPLHGEDGRTTVSSQRRQIWIEVDLEPAHAAVTILHEAGHALMHSEVSDYQQHRGIYETEAEAVAYVTAGVLGLDSAANSIGYIASWAGGDPTLVKLTAEKVLQTARIILDGVTVSRA